MKKRADDWKITTDVIEAARALAERDVRLDIITEAQLRYTIESRKKTAVEMKALGYSNRAIAKRTGSSHQTVARDLGGPNGPENGPDGPRPTHKHYRAQGTGDCEWYTPAQYIEVARTVLGGIDVDPASHKVAQRTVKAKKFFTIKDDGLSSSREWHGRAFLNPPYSQPAMRKFVSKLITEVHSGRVTAAILLTHNFTDTKWFQEAGARADAICFPNHRIMFVHQNGRVLESSTNGQAFFYFGNDVAGFVKHFGPFGLIVVPWIRKPV
jgi:hypothetical protein